MLYEVITYVVARNAQHQLPRRQLGELHDAVRHVGELEREFRLAERARDVRGGRRVRTQCA